jgi:hypothetical protein
VRSYLNALRWGAPLGFDAFDFLLQKKGFGFAEGF